MKHDVPCKKCGKAHGMTIHDTLSDTHTPLDVCHDCMIYGIVIDLGVNDLLGDIED